MSWTSQNARELCDRIFSFSKARECEVSLELDDSGHTRFAANDVTTAGTARRVRVQITSREGGKGGSTTTDQLDDSLLREAVERSEALMAASQPNPEQVEGLGPQHYPEIPAYDEPTALASPVKLRDGVRPALDRARNQGLNASGFFETTAGSLRSLIRKGTSASTDRRGADYSVTMRTSDGTGSGHASFASPRVADIDAAALAGQAAAKAESSAHPRDLPPGRYTVILEPGAVADLLMWLVISMMPVLLMKGKASFPSLAEAAGWARRCSPTASPCAPTRLIRAIRVLLGPGLAAISGPVNPPCFQRGEPRGSRTEWSALFWSTATGPRRPRSSPCHSPVDSRWKAPTRRSSL